MNTTSDLWAVNQAARTQLLADIDADAYPDNGLCPWHDRGSSEALDASILGLAIWLADGAARERMVDLDRRYDAAYDLAADEDGIVREWPDECGWVVGQALEFIHHAVAPEYEVEWGNEESFTLTFIQKEVGQ